MYTIHGIQVALLQTLKKCLVDEWTKCGMQLYCLFNTYIWKGWLTEMEFLLFLLNYKFFTNPLSSSPSILTLFHDREGDDVGKFRNGVLNGLFKVCNQGGLKECRDIALKRTKGCRTPKELKKINYQLHSFFLPFFLPPFFPLSPSLLS